MIRLMVASTNPVKINAALEGFRRMFPDQLAEAHGISVPSGVSDQPMTSDETLQGALNRARAVRQAAPDADYWIGIEGGVQPHGDPPESAALEALAWIVVLGQVGGRDCTGKGRTGSFFLPEESARLVRQGIELGHADDQVFGRSNSKQQNGSVGLLTHDIIDRTEYYIHAVILALIPFKNPMLTFNLMTDP